MTRNPDIVDAVLKAGYIGGFIPSQPRPHPPMEGFLSELLEVIGE